MKKFNLVKRLVVAALVVTVGVGLVACGEKGDDNVTTDKTADGVLSLLPAKLPTRTLPYIPASFL